jgi:hypothetical protein
LQTSVQPQPSAERPLRDLTLLGRTGHAARRRRTGLSRQPLPQNVRGLAKLLHHERVAGPDRMDVEERQDVVVLMHHMARHFATHRAAAMAAERETPPHLTKVKIHGKIDLSIPRRMTTPEVRHSER